MQKTARVYVVIIITWVALMVGSFTPLLKAVLQSEHHGWVTLTLVTASSLFIAYFWLNGIKDLIYTFYYHLFRKQLVTVPPRAA